MQEILAKQEKDKGKINIFSKELFSDFGLDKRLLRALNDDGFIKCTEIQKLAFAKVNEWKNCMIKSQTGSGKTLSYLIPIFQNLLQEQNISRSQGVFILVICPTRELCL